MYIRLHGQRCKFRTTPLVECMALYVKSDNSVFVILPCEVLNTREVKKKKMTVSLTMAMKTLEKYIMITNAVTKNIFN